jgi:hypothetical protein
MGVELLGLIDAIEAVILDSPRFLFSDKILIKEKKILEMLAKLRIVAQTDGEAAQRAVKGEQMPRVRSAGVKRPDLGQLKMTDHVPDGPVQKTVEQVLAEAKSKAETTVKGADEYAKDILNQLLIVTTKIQRTLENGKARMEKQRK